MANYKKKNNAKSTLVGSISALDNNLLVLDASKFPTSPEFVLTIWNKNVYLNPSDDPNMEIVKITSITSGNHFFITRAQEGTSAHPHNAGDNIEMLITAGQAVDSQKYLLKTGPSDTPIISDGIQVDDLQSDKAIITNASAIYGYPDNSTLLAEQVVVYTEFDAIATQQDVLGHTKTITFSSPATLVKGQKYAVVLDYTLTNDSDNWYAVANKFGQIAGKEYALDFGYYLGSYTGYASSDFYEMYAKIYVDDVADYDLMTNIIGDSVLGSNSNNPIWQSFVAGASGELTKIDLGIARKGNPGSLKVQIRPLAVETKAISRSDITTVTDNLIKSKQSDSLLVNKTILATYHPDTHKGCFGNVIATATLTPSDVTTSYAEYDIVFDTPAQVYKGWRYAIHCRIDSTTYEKGRYVVQGYNGAVDQYTDGYQYQFQEYYPNVYQDIQTDFNTYGEFWFKTYLSNVVDVSVTPATLNHDSEVYWLQSGSIRDRISRGQTFIPLNNGNLNKIRLKILKHPSYLPTFNLIIEIRKWVENKENIIQNGFFKNLPMMGLGARIGNNITLKDVEEGVGRAKYLYNNKHTQNTDSKINTTVPYISDVPSETILATQTFTGLSGFTWQTLTFSTPATVVAGRKYALVFRAPTGQYYVYEATGIYADGQISHSSNSGGDWTQNGNDPYGGINTYVANVLDISFVNFSYASAFLVNGVGYLAYSIKPNLSGLLNKIELYVQTITEGTGITLELRDVTEATVDFLDNGNLKEDLTVTPGKKIGTKVIEDYQDAVDKKHEHLNQHLNLGTGELKVKVFAQATEPTLNADDYMAIWKDTSVSGLPNVYLVFRRGTGDQVKVLFNV